MQWQLFPAFFLERAEALHREHADGGQIPPEMRFKLAADTVASLTDRQALLLYQKFTGVSQTSMLDSAVS
jgi:hypothetical protein